MNETIRLARGVWQFDPNQPLGRAGGFGQVFRGQDSSGGAVAVKRLNPTPNDAGHREMDIAASLMDRSLKNVVPVLDAGLDAESDHYFVVMPIAEKSLQDHLRLNGKLQPVESVQVLRAIAAGLAEVEDIVHRDLKPDNVLYHDGNWKVADFGIAKFVEDSTSLHTLKFSKTPQYAAPEQWQGRRVTKATDVYALGCVGVALLTGKPPFPGPSPADFQEQHLRAVPQIPLDAPPILQSTLRLMLRKPPEGRPSLERVMAMLDQSLLDNTGAASRPGLEGLARIGAKAVEQRTKQEAEEVVKEAKHRERAERVVAARLILRETLGEFLKVLQSAMPIHAEGWLRPEDVKQFMHFMVDNAALTVSWFDLEAYIPESAFARSGWDVLTGATIHVMQLGSEQYRWGANLWYTNLGKGTTYRWYEIPYFRSALRSSDGSVIHEPFAVDSVERADMAASPGMAPWQHAVSQPLPVDDEATDSFIDRWSHLLVLAYEGKLQHPRNLPLRDEYGYP